MNRILQIFYKQFLRLSMTITTSTTTLLVPIKTVIKLINLKIRVTTKYRFNKFSRKAVSPKLKERLCWTDSKRKSRLNRFMQSSRLQMWNRSQHKLVLHNRKIRIKIIIIKIKKRINRIGNRNNKFRMKLNRIIRIKIMKKMII
jgi:hypothetical protein